MTLGRTLCDADGRLHLAGFKSMARSLLATHGTASGSSVANQPRLKAAAAAAAGNLRRWLHCGGGGGAAAPDKSDAEEVLCCQRACALAHTDL
jgi:hypothetical protein